MKTLCEVTWEKEEQAIDGDTAYAKGKFWLHHWGLRYEIIHLSEGNVMAVNYTVAICEDYKTGEVRVFLPEQLKILGEVVKK